MTETKAPTITIGDIEHEIRLDVLAMRRLRRSPYRIDIGRVIDDDKPKEGLLYKMREDPSIAVDICYEGLGHWADRPDPEAFAQAIGGGDQLEAVVDAALDAVILFTPSHRLRPVLAALKETADQAQGEALDRIMEAHKDGTLKAEIEKMIEEETKRPGALIPKTGSAKSAPSSGSSTTGTTGSSPGSRSATSTKSPGSKTGSSGVDSPSS